MASFLAKLIQDIEFGEIDLREIQMPFVWANTKIRDLLTRCTEGSPQFICSSGLMGY